MLTRYRAGLILHVTRKPKGSGDLKWLTSHDEAWVMCFKGGGRIWRMLGRFAAPNLFVGLHCVERHELDPWAKYQARAVAMIGDWNNFFPECEPYRGQEFEDYLGDMVLNKDA